MQISCIQPGLALEWGACWRELAKIISFGHVLATRRFAPLWRRNGETGNHLNRKRIRRMMIIDVIQNIQRTRLQQLVEKEMRRRRGANPVVRMIEEFSKCGTAIGLH